MPSTATRLSKIAEMLAYECNRSRPQVSKIGERRGGGGKGRPAPNGQDQAAPWAVLFPGVGAFKRDESPCACNPVLNKNSWGKSADARYGSNGCTTFLPGSKVGAPERTALGCLYAASACQAASLGPRCSANPKNPPSQQACNSGSPSQIFCHLVTWNTFTSS